MSTWDYRVTKRRVAETDVFEIREIYYRDDGSISAWTEVPSAPFGESVSELWEDAIRIMKALESDVINLDEVELDALPSVPPDRSTGEGTVR